MLGGLGPSQGIKDIEGDIMSYCLKKRGKWWATHFFWNREVDELYDEIRSKDVDEVMKIIDE